MTGKTHKTGGVLYCFVTYSLLKSKGLLIGNVNPILQLLIMYPFAIYGSMFPDLDHSIKNIPTDDTVSILVNKVLHLTTKSRKMKEKLIGKSEPQKPFKPTTLFDARHRSWQTHSDIFLLVFLFLYYKIPKSNFSTPNTIILSLAVEGMLFGIISHLVLDMLTPEGIWSALFCLINKIRGKEILPDKFSLVPNTKFFSTGESWEKCVRFILRSLSFIYLIILLIDMSPYKINFK